MIMKSKDKKDICLISTTHDNRMVPTRVQGQDMEKPRVVIDYNSRTGVVDLSDARLTSYCSTGRRLKQYCQKHFYNLIYICCLNSCLFKKEKGQQHLQDGILSETYRKFDFKISYNGGRQLKTAPLTWMNAPHPSYIAAIVSKQSQCWRCVMCCTNGQHHEIRYNCEN
jgi:hypothetical protein